MKYCPHCGKELIGNISFCPYCGKPLSLTASLEPPTDNALSTQEKPVVITKTKPRVSKKLIFGILIGFIAIAVALVLLTNPFAGNFSENPDAIQKAANSVVKLYMYDYNGILQSSGSGFAALDEGIIITNHHCIEGNVYSIIAERKNSSTFHIESVVAYDEEKDIAILRAPDSNLEPLKTANGLNTKQGEKLAAIGSPTGMSNMFSTGTLSKIGDWGTHYVLVSTVSISPGSSGGALFNNKGKVIGVTSAGSIDGNEIYFSVPFEYVKELYEKRDPKDELTLAEFYDLSEHLYDADYLLTHGEKFHTQEVVVYGYITGMGADIYLVSSLENVLYIDVRGPWDNSKKAENAYLLQEFPSVLVDLPIDSTYLSSLNPGDPILVEGRLLCFGPGDVRIMNPTIIKLE